MTDSFTSYISRGQTIAMGRRLADELIEQGYVRKNIAVVTYENDCDNINRRKEGLMDTLSRTNNAVSFWTLKNDGTKGIRQLQELLNQEPVDTIVALDLSILELAAQMIDDNELETVSIWDRRYGEGGLLCGAGGNQRDDCTERFCKRLFGSAVCC